MWDTPEDAFAELSAKNFNPIAESIYGYYKALTAQGFNPNQAFRLTEKFSAYILEWALEDAIQQGFDEEAEKPDSDT